MRDVRLEKKKAGLCSCPFSLESQLFSPRSKNRQQKALASNNEVKVELTHWCWRALHNRQTAVCRGGKAKTGPAACTASSGKKTRSPYTFALFLAAHKALAETSRINCSSRSKRPQSKDSPTQHSSHELWCCCRAFPLQWSLWEQRHTPQTAMSLPTSTKTEGDKAGKMV